MAPTANLQAQPLWVTQVWSRELFLSIPALGKASCHFAESNGIETRKEAFTFGSSQQILCAKREPGMGIKSSRNVEGTEYVLLASWQQQGSG